ncbi:hypothetical protein EUX98_g9524 [Antrodiella citrinella]|uniref:Helitron helicase-like domain-containing protein n=1 Tax=Antrodiella citrinella TaxID=2447956 RepID=A0A4S4LRN7_9APHY|nr:hypothetical protein EUX98_g9524 [Antrodiella citrinella]
MLPEDDVPPEIMAIVRRNDESGSLEEETHPYVPNHESPSAAGGNGGVPPAVGVPGEREDENEHPEDPDVVPLNVAGTVDLDMSHNVQCDVGVLGEVAAYVGCVESQGRGTLHLHLMLWLKHAPSSDEMTVLLQDERFRDRMKQYMEANIKAFVPGLESAESLRALDAEADIAYNRPPTPGSKNYEEQLRAFELRLARTEQVHTCKTPSFEKQESGE